MKIRPDFPSIYLWLLSCLLISLTVSAESAMTNIYGRNYTSLNGKWEIIIDQASEGNGRRIFQNKQPEKDTDFFEYSFSSRWQLNVPGDFNSQRPELRYYESSVWYKKDFTVNKKEDKRYFIYFGGANYLTNVYVNGKFTGVHEGGFTPFQFEITRQINSGDNFIVVQVNNARREDGIPSLRYDWWNYGGITRDVMLVETPAHYLLDYTIALAGKDTRAIEIRAYTDSTVPAGEMDIQVEIPELKIKQLLQIDAEGNAHATIKAKPQLWSPDYPKLYDIILSTPFETIYEQIGFKTIETKGTDILLNGKSVFLKGINIHEEIPMREGRAFSEADAALLLREAKKLGANFIRFGHISPFEKIIRMAEEMGFMIWEEIPTWQKITFDNPKTVATGENMLKEMIARDKNRCAIIIWSIANETRNSDARNAALSHYIRLVRSLDPTRLVSAAFNNMAYDHTTQTLTLNDPVAELLDIVSINKYFGWYTPWPVDPEQLNIAVATNKPLIYSEFGGEALYGNDGDAQHAYSWGELHQEKLYLDHIRMFKHITNLRGTCPWVLFDFKSPSRMNQEYQQEWNRKGLISDQGFRKKAWYVMKEYYAGK